MTQKYFILLIGLLLFIATGVIIAIFQGYKVLKSIGNNENFKGSISQVLISIGISTMCAGYVGGFDRVLLLVGMILERKDLENIASFNSMVFITGVCILILGVIINYIDKNYIYVLNINAYSKKNIEKEQLDIGIKNIKEKEIDIINTYTKRFKPNYDEEYMKDIIEVVKDNVTAFKYESRGRKSGYTGIAPIPIIMYAGAFMDRIKIDEYIEFDNRDTKKYYKLIEKDKKYSKMKVLTNFNSIDKQATEIVLAVSVTQKIKDSQLIQFGSIDKVHLSIKNVGDNSIKSKKQLKQYTNQVIETAEELGRIMPNLKKIHLVCSAQSCLALEIGRMCPEGTRISEIICYQFEINANIKYPWGIVINGDGRGRFIKGREVGQCMI